MSITKKVPNGGYKYPDWDPSGTASGDHKVAVDQTDEDAGGADYLRYQIIDGTRTSWHVDTSGGQRRMRVDVDASGIDDHRVLASATDTTPNYLHSKIAAGPGTNTDLIPSSDPDDQAVRISARFYQGAMRADAGDGSAGDITDETVAKGTHSHPATAPADPATYAGDLYTAVFDDPLDHRTVKCILTHGEDVTFGEDASAEYGPGSWRRTDLSGYWGQPSGGIYDPPITLFQGDRILVWLPGASPGSAPHFWVYEVIDPGYHEGAPSTYGVIRRAADANSSATVKAGAFVFIQQGQHAGDYAVITNAGSITLDTTPIEITMLGSRTASPTWPLVTAKQLAGSSDAERRATASATSASPAYFGTLGPRYEMLFGTSMPTEVPAGDWEIQIACKVSSLTDASSGDAPCDTIIRSVFGIVDMSGTPTYSTLFTVDSEPIKFIGTEQVLSVPVPDLSGFSLGPDQYFYWTPQARTTSVGAIVVTILVNSPQHLTRIRTPLTFATTGGTNRHPELIDRGIRGQHPALAIDPTTPESVTITAGVMPAVTYGSWANVTSASANLDAMDANGFPDYGEREVYFSVGCTIRSDQSTTGTNRPIRTYRGTFATYQTAGIRAGATVRFRYRPDLGTSGMWLITGVQQG